MVFLDLRIAFLGIKNYVGTATIIIALKNYVGTATIIIALKRMEKIRRLYASSIQIFAGYALRKYTTYHDYFVKLVKEHWRAIYASVLLL